jgi:hypothetical protein
MARKKRSPIEAFIALSDDEKERIWASFNRSIPLSETRALTPTERRAWERAKRKPGRPPKGEGATAVSVTIERGLLRRADAYAKSQGMTRAQLITRGLSAILPADRGSGSTARGSRRKAS